MDIPKSHFCSPTFTYHGEHCNHKMQRIISCCKFSLLSTVNSNKCVIRCKQTDNNQSFLHPNPNLNCRVVYTLKVHTRFLYYTKHATQIELTHSSYVLASSDTSFQSDSISFFLLLALLVSCKVLHDGRRMIQRARK